IKQYIEETNLRAVILLDASGSMSYTGTRSARHEGAALSKFQYATYLAASLAHLMIHQQDAVGLVTFDSKVRRYIPPRSRISHLQAILQELAGTQPGADTALSPILHDIAERANRRGLMIVISDLFDDGADLLKALHHFRYRKHEVLLLHVMAEEEISFPFDTWSEFRDLETTVPEVRVDPRSIKAEYVEHVKRFCEELESGAGRMQVDYVLLKTSEPFDAALAGFLARRKARTK
ncbi:MAG: VWA domain-containing protein, partial [Planctomycetota bacterium]|nr:VWA domain-containing protein [Planctomycetota bacterium]